MDIKNLIESFKSINLLEVADKAKQGDKEATRTWFLYGCYKKLKKTKVEEKEIIKILEFINPRIEVTN